MVNLDDLRRRITQGAEKRVRDGAPILLQKLSDAAPVAADGGGTLRDSIIVGTTGLTTTVIVGVPYATFTIEDTQPHEIRGRPLLAFKWPKVGPGIFIFHRVQHPGTSGTVDWYGPIVKDWNLILERVA